MHLTPCVSPVYLPGALASLLRKAADELSCAEAIHRAFRVLPASGQLAGHRALETLKGSKGVARKKDLKRQGTRRTDADADADDVHGGAAGRVLDEAEGEFGQSVRDEFLVFDEYALREQVCHLPPSPATPCACI